MLCASLCKSVQVPAMHVLMSLADTLSMTAETIMAGAHFTFKTTKFTDSDEIRSQNVNRLAGHTLGTWLAEKLGGAGLSVTEVYPEDYGWDFCVTHQGS